MNKRVYLLLVGLIAVLLVLALTRPQAVDPAVSAATAPRVEVGGGAAHATAAKPASSAVSSPGTPVRPGTDESMSLSADAKLAQPSAPQSKPTVPAGSLRLDLLAQARNLGKEGDAFGAKSWVIVPPPPPPAPIVAEAPRAPPLPFRFMGQVNDGHGNITYFLLRGTAMLAASVGESIDNIYRLERAEGGVLHFIYLPLQVRQSLQIGVAP